MKKRVIIFLLFGLFCLNTVWVEGNDNASSWMRVYTTGRQPLTTYPEGIPIDPTGYLVGTDVVVSPQGNIMVAAYVGDPGSPELLPARTAVGCLTSNGSIVWSREYFLIEPPNSLKPSYSPFGFGAWAQLLPYSNEDNVAFALTFANNLLLLNTEGMVLHSYLFPEITYLTDLLTLPDGGLVLVGIGASSSMGEPSSSGIKIFRLTFPSEEDPIILWAKEINGLISKIQTPYPRPEVVYTMNEDGNNYLWIGAEGGFLICLSEDGNLLGTWKLGTKKGAKIHNNHGQVRYLQYGVLATDQQGHLFFGGSLGVKSSYTSAFSQFSLIACLTSDPTNLNLVWASALTENTGYGLGSSIHDLQVLGGELFITGDTSLWGQDEGNFNQAAYAARLGVDGSVAWVRLLGRKKQSQMMTEYSDELGHSIALTGDGGAVLVGGTSSFSHPEPWRQIVKEAMTIHPELLVVRLGPGGEVGNIGFGRYPNLGLAPELGNRSTQVDVLTPDLIIEEINLTTEEITITIEAISFGTRDGGWVERELRGQRNPGDQPPIAIIHLLNREEQFWENIVWLDGSASYDPEGGYIICYQWDFGDGKTYTSTSPQVSHKYAMGDKYKVTLTVTDEQGFTASKSISIVVGNTLSYQGKRKINIGIPAALIVPDEQLVNYLIEITTGDVQDAGTDSFVYLALFGPKKDNGRYGSGEMNPYNARDPYGPFERGQTDSFSNQGYNLDEVEFMTLRHNNSYNKPGWYVEAVKVKNTSNNKEWLFVPNQWLAMDEPPEYQT